MTRRERTGTISGRASRPAGIAGREDDFWVGWRHGYGGEGKSHHGAAYDRGWKMGHADRIVDRSGSAF